MAVAAGVYWGINGASLSARQRWRVDMAGAALGEF
jgi:hypothetical protein